MPKNLFPARWSSRAGNARSGATILPISRVHLDITDSNAFEKGVRECAVWLANRVGVVLPSSALDGEPFDVSDLPGASPCKSPRIPASNGTVWAARLDDPDRQAPQRTWRTEIVLRRQVGNSASRPGLVRQIVQNLSAECDGWPIDDQITNAISGAAHVVVLDYERCRDLTRAIGKRLSVYNGAVRLYRQGFAEGSTPYTHRLWLQPIRDEPSIGF